MFSNNIQVGPRDMVVTKTPLMAPAYSWDLTQVASMKITEVGLYWFHFNIQLEMNEELTQTQIDTTAPEYQQFLMCCFIQSPSGVLYPLKSCAPCYFQGVPSNSVARANSARTVNITNDMLPCNEAGEWTVQVVANCAYSGGDASIGYNADDKSQFICRKISNYQF